LSKITGHAGVDAVQYLKGDIYNGNTFSIDSVTVKIDVLDSARSVIFSRTYKLDENFAALSDTEIIERTDISLLVGQSIN